MTGEVTRLQPPILTDITERRRVEENRGNPEGPEMQGVIRERNKL